MTAEEKIAYTIGTITTILAMKDAKAAPDALVLIELRKTLIAR